MGTQDDESTALQTRSQDKPGDQPGAEPQLRQRIQALEAEAARLREANEHLVLATVHAQSSRDDAEAANRRQNEFLAMLAHELRNPLAPISMAATLLERMPQVSPQLLHLTQVVGRQVGHMSRLLDDLLDAARISSGKIRLAVETVLLADVIEQAVETVQPRARERGQRLFVELSQAPLVLEGDRVRLTQVFSNLLANASKYTDDGGAIRIAATAAGDSVEVAIADSGMGIAEEVLPHIFDLFTQGPRSLARSEGGLGIGLNVVRNLVVMHGGQVSAKSAGPGQGSTFTVRLALSTRQASPVAALAGPSLDARSRRVLLIEDNLDACSTLQSLLVHEGHEVATANEGKAGLAAAIDGTYDVIVCDIGLPGLDGLALIQALRAAPGVAQPLAIALSGYGQAEGRERARNAGFDHYLVKPASVQGLLALIAAPEVESL